MLKTAKLPAQNCLPFLQSYTGESYAGNKPVRRAVYALMDRQYTEQDIRAVIQMACHGHRRLGEGCWTQWYCLARTLTG